MCYTGNEKFRPNSLLFCFVKFVCCCCYCWLFQTHDYTFAYIHRQEPMFVSDLIWLRFIRVKSFQPISVSWFLRWVCACIFFVIELVCLLFRIKIFFFYSSFSIVRFGEFFFIYLFIAVNMRFGVCVKLLLLFYIDFLFFFFVFDLNVKAAHKYDCFYISIVVLLLLFFFRLSLLLLFRLTYNIQIIFFF